MKIKISNKLSDNNRSFLRRVGINDAFANKKEKSMTISQVLDRIEKYFKLNNDEYNEMISMGEENEHK